MANIKYEFIFNGNITNEVLVHNRMFHLNRTQFGSNYRVDIIDNKGFSHSENTGNYDFNKIIDTTKTLDEQMVEWANYIINKYEICDICGNLEMILELHDYDLEIFPQLKGKKVCDKCRTRFYNEHLNNLQDEIINEQNKEQQGMKQNGYKYLYTFWIHPSRGDDFEENIYSSKKLTKRQIENQKNDFREKYMVSLIEEPICRVL